MKQWWSQLQKKERHLVILMGVLITFFLCYHLIWSPISQGLEQESKKLKRNQELKVYVEHHIGAAKTQKGGAKQPGNGTLSSVINRVARGYDIAITRVQPQGEDIQVWINEVSFNTLLIWLADLTQNNGLQVKTIDITEGSADGMVKIRRLQLGTN